MREQNRNKNQEIEEILEQMDLSQPATGNRADASILVYEESTRTGERTV